MNRTTAATLLRVLALVVPAQTHAAGILTPRLSGNSPIAIRDHHVNVTINNGFAVTEVIQTFYNPNHIDLQAVYSFPLPKRAALSEVTVYAGDRELHGEVIEKEKATRTYAEERSRGRDAGLATKESFRHFRFKVQPVPARRETRLRFVYYEPIEVDAGVGRYLYPLADGETDESSRRLSRQSTTVQNSFSVHLDLKSAWPVTGVHASGFRGVARVEKSGDRQYVLDLELGPGTTLGRDFVFTYKLRDDLPGRVEIVPYRADGGVPGTFMMVVTPGLDLSRLDQGVDSVLVLDTSRSMRTKTWGVGRGVADALRTLDPADRYRIVAFSSSARELTDSWTPAVRSNLTSSIHEVLDLRSSGKTNLYEGMRLALRDIDSRRTTSLILVTDGVANTGFQSPQAFRSLLRKTDLRVSGLLMGNSANWPLMRAICDASGGLATGVSNQDDIADRIRFARERMTHQCLHDASVKIKGVGVTETTDALFRKVYHGQQLVIFGRYARGGRATVELKARLSGEDKTYSVDVEFPAVDTENPEIERLWALKRIEMIEAEMNAGSRSAEKAQAAITALAIEHQLVTDYTSMVILEDAAYEERGIARKNRPRAEKERIARAARKARKPKGNWKERSKSASSLAKKGVGVPLRLAGAVATLGVSEALRGTGGGAAFDPLSGCIALSLAGVAVAARRRATAGGERRAPESEAPVSGVQSREVHDC